MSKPNLYGNDLLGEPIEPDLPGVLRKAFLWPPFSVLDARKGDWQERKAAWITAYGIQSEIGRGGNLLALSDGCEQYRQRAGDYSEPSNRKKHNPSLKDGLAFGLTQNPYGDEEAYEKKIAAQEEREDMALIPVTAVRRDIQPRHARVQGPSQPCIPGGHALTAGAYRKRGDEVSSADCGTSVFDPFLCELMYKWFCPPGGTVVDPFAGGSVRGIVAGALGRRYWGSDLSKDQIEANRVQARNLFGERGPVAWVVGDSERTVREAPDADMIFSCPPYHDLEVYSKDPDDLSNMPYAKFRDKYEEIIYRTCQALRPDRFAVFVIGDVRDERGMYRNLPAHTTAAFRNAGLELYNEMILITAVGSLSIRTKRQFDRSRKVGNTHQRVICYVKGDPVRATELLEVVPGGGEAEEWEDRNRSQRSSS